MLGDSSSLGVSQSLTLLLSVHQDDNIGDISSLGKDGTMELITTIPANVMKLIQGKKVVEAGFGAGPGSAAGQVHKFVEPVELTEGINWIERYRQTLRTAHIMLDDRTVLWFYQDGYNRYEKTPRDKPPRPGVEVKIAD